MPERDVTKPSLTSLRDARRAPRFPTKLKAVLHIGRQRLPIVIGDISRTGALILGSGMPPKGQRVALIAQGLEVTGTVMWRDEAGCGVDFHEMVDPLAIVRDNLVQFAWLKRRPSEPPERATA